MLSDFIRRVRNRVDDIDRRLDNIRRAKGPSGSGFIAQIKDNGNMPTTLPGIFAADIIRVGGPSIEGAETTRTVVGHAFVTVFGGSVPTFADGEYLQAKRVPFSKWVAYDNGCANPLCFQFSDCGGPVEGVKITLTPTFTGGKTITATTDATGKVCFPQNAKLGDYTASYEVPDGYTAPEDEDIKINRCGGTVSKSLYPKPGLFKLSPVGAPQPAPSGLTLTTPGPTAKLNRIYEYGIQQSNTTDFTNALITYFGYTDGPAYAVQSLSGAGQCMGFDRIQYGIAYWPCGTWGLSFFMSRCFSGEAVGDTPPGDCLAGCLPPSGNTSHYQADYGGDWLFSKHDWVGIGACGIYNGLPLASGHCGSFNSATDGTIYIDFGFPNQLYNTSPSGPCFTSDGFNNGVDEALASVWRIPLTGGRPPIGSAPVGVGLVATL